MIYVSKHCTGAKKEASVETFNDITNAKTDIKDENSKERLCAAEN